MRSAETIRVFQTAEHRCGYWAERTARDLVLDPHDDQLATLYQGALMMGFRRSGGHVYRPHCPGCTACVPVRIAVDDFAPDRSQRRCARANADLELKLKPARRTAEHFALYRHYLTSRHAGGGMDAALPEDFDQFLTCVWSPTRFLELRQGRKLLAVAVTDVLPNALSAVYTFFDPDQTARGLGTASILRQIDWARANGRAHLYLGYWIGGHPKMDYKTRFRPMEALRDGRWARLD